ncbi:MAG: MBL fold metallo-hydrolase [Bacillota bacterium]
MKVTVLGNRSPYPTLDSGCSSYLIQNQGANILLDCGPTTLQNLQKIIPCHELNAVIISHLHLDHFLDLLPLHYAIMLAIKRGLRKEALAVYLPFTASSELQFIKSKVGDEFHLQELTKSSSLNYGGLDFQFHPTTHSKECLAVKISGGNSSVGYTADTAVDEALIQFFKGSKLLLAEASLLEQDAQRRKSGHMTVKDAVNFGMQAEVNKLLLTHLASVYKRKDIKREIPENNLEVIVTKALDSCFIEM